MTERYEKSPVKKFRQNNEIHCNIVLPRRKNLLRGILVQEQQIPRIQYDTRRFINNMGRRPAAHVNNFDIIMTVLRKTHKPRMRPDID